ncbi:MAG TPA: phosphoribosyl-ATP diphosphatase [Anaerolineae bacterium]
MSQVLSELYATIRARQEAPPAGSYTASLFAAGLTQIAQKIGEEAMEVMVAALAESKDRVLSESADLIYHLLVLLAQREVEWREVEEELQRRGK